MAATGLNVGSTTGVGVVEKVGAGVAATGVIVG